MVSVLIFLPLLLKSPPKKISYSQILAPESDSIIMWVTKVNEYMETEEVTGAITGDTTKVYGKRSLKTI